LVHINEDSKFDVLSARMLPGKKMKRLQERNMKLLAKSLCDSTQPRGAWSMSRGAAAEVLQINSLTSGSLSGHFVLRGFGLSYYWLLRLFSGRCESLAARTGVSECDSSVNEMQRIICRSSVGWRQKKIGAEVWTDIGIVFHSAGSRKLKFGSSAWYLSFIARHQF
jgi:hypothetical protein